MTAVWLQFGVGTTEGVYRVEQNPRVNPSASVSRTFCVKYIQSWPRANQTIPMICSSGSRAWAILPEARGEWRMHWRPVFHRSRSSRSSYNGLAHTACSSESVTRCQRCLCALDRAVIQDLTPLTWATACQGPTRARKQVNPLLFAINNGPYTPPLLFLSCSEALWLSRHHQHEQGCAIVCPQYIPHGYALYSANCSSPTVWLGSCLSTAGRSLI